MQRHSTFGLPALLALASFAIGCASTGSPAEREGAVTRGIAAARIHKDAGREAEALLLLSAVRRVAPDGSEALRLELETRGEVPDWAVHPLLGSTVARRPTISRSLPARIALFVPDRLLDLLDVFSFDLHFGWGAHANLHLTRALQVGAGARSTAGVGWHDHRSLGTKVWAESELVAVAVGAGAYSGSLFGSSGARSVGDGIAGLHDPGDPLYQELRDYWSVGASLTAVIIGVELDFHPVDFADFVAGFAGADIQRDDFASTRGISLDPADEALLRVLGGMPAP